MSDVGDFLRRRALVLAALRNSAPTAAPSTKACLRCFQEKPLEAFNLRNDGSDHRRPECKACQYATRNLERDREWKKSAIADRRSVVDRLKSDPCVDCGMTFEPRVMQFDHRDPNSKMKAVSRMVADRRPIEEILAEIEKCDLVCANCHAARTHARRTGSEFRPLRGGGAPASVGPDKTPDAPAGVPTSAPDRGAAPSPFVIPPPKVAGGKASRALSVKQMRADQKRDERLNGERPPTPPVEGRPKTRGECEGGPRPCPLVGCRHHTALEVTEAGSLVVSRPDAEPAELTASCSLDVADAGPVTLEQAGAVLNLTRERVRQVETAALHKVKVAVEGQVFRGSCRAICAVSGRQCRLPAHDASTPHRHERGPFHLVAVPGQAYFPEKRRLEEVAMSNPTELGLGHG